MAIRDHVLQDQPVQPQDRLRVSDVLQRPQDFGVWLSTRDCVDFIPCKSLAGAYQWILRHGIPRRGNGSVLRRDIERELDRMRRKPRRIVPAASLGLTAIVRDGLIRACGSLKAAAITMAMDQGQLTRDLQSGAFKFERLEKLSAEEKATVIACLHAAYEPLAKSPQQHTEQLIDRIQSDLNEVRQFVRSA